MTDAAPLPRVGVNLMWCIPGAVGGSEQYLVRQHAGALEARADLAPTLWTTASFAHVHGERLGGARFEIAPVDGHARWRRVLAEQTWLHRAGARAGVELVHHGGGTAPARARRPYLLTLHDLQYLTFPGHFSRLKRTSLAAAIPPSVRRAALVTVPSEYVRGTVVERLSAPPERVMVVPHGYEPELLSERTPESELRRRFGLGDGPVLVYPAMTAPHKNHTFLVDLMDRVWLEEDLRLVLVGGEGAAADEVAAAVAAAERRRPGRIVHAGRVSDADRNGLLAMAASLVFPSRYEGFGAPVIEAMALGAPVLCSDATCLPEVAGDAAVVAPLRADAWEAGLAEVRRRRTELVRRGAERVAAFTNRRSGEALLDAYARAVRR